MKLTAKGISAAGLIAAVFVRVGLELLERQGGYISVPAPLKNDIAIEYAAELVGGLLGLKFFQTYIDPQFDKVSGAISRQKAKLEKDRLTSSFPSNSP